MRIFWSASRRKMRSGSTKQGGRGISQHLRFKKQEGTYIWAVHILDDTVAERLCPILDELEQVSIERRSFALSSKEVRQISLNELLAREAPANRSTLCFNTPTAFKQSGRYTIFPQERLILQSLIFRWNEAFPVCPLEDQDAFEALLAGIHIVDYRLQTSRFLLKNVRIPGFTGSCSVEAKLAPPLLELWNTLLVFSNYAGVGIKTGIGMGGVQSTLHSRT